MVGIGLFIVDHRDRDMRMLLLGGAITGGGVAAMHYTGMAAMRAHASPDMGATPSGAEAVQLLTPLIVVVSVITTVLLLNIAASDNGDSPESADR